jgi:hypothetical protein
MKKLVLLSAAVLAVAACSESTAPGSTLDARFDKPGPPPGPTVVGSLTSDAFNFEDGSISGAAGTSWAVDDLAAGGFSAAAPGIVTAYNNSTMFMGRVDNHALFLVVPNGGSKWSLAFDLYIIGSWDGQGQQAQHGAFGQDIWSLEVRCSVNSAPVQVLLETDFSNQETVQQSFPRSTSQNGGSKAGTGGYGKDLLGFRNDPAVHTPSFRSYGDTEYALSFSGFNPCGAGNPLVFAFEVPNAGLQSNYDESWGVDNVIVKTDL